MDWHSSRYLTLFYHSLSTFAWKPIVSCVSAISRPSSSLSSGTHPETSQLCITCSVASCLLRSSSLAMNQTSAVRHCVRGCCSLSPAKVLSLTSKYSRQRRNCRTASSASTVGDRFLVVDTPVLKGKKLPRGQSGQDIKRSLPELFSREQDFLGRTWVQFYVKENKRKLGGGDAGLGKPGTYQVVFFAVSGEGLIDVGICELLNWFIHFERNSDRTSSKAFARLDLGMSRNTPTLLFTPSQIRYGVGNKRATDEEDDHTFDDFLMSFEDPPFSHADREVMNDGCSEISLAAMDLVRKNLGLDYIPAAVQGRILGAKGVWYRSAGQLTPNSTPAPEDVWIDISESQIKARHVLNDAFDDSELLTLNVVAWSSQLKPTVLHTGFLPVFRDRYVPAKSILEIAKRQVLSETENFVEALSNPALLQRWLHTQRDVMSKRVLSGVWAVGEDGFPVMREERALLMIEAGFLPTKCYFLGTELIKLGMQEFDLQAKRFRIQLNQSTSAIGIADPIGILKPGQIHLCFSRSIHDNDTGQSWSALHGQKVIVSRNPSMRNSDAQPYTAVCIPELMHLQDVVIFPSRGRRSAASKLSGGDYDGDTFWVTWDPALTEAYRNAPAPWKLTSPEMFGMHRDTVKLGEIVKGVVRKGSEALQSETEGQVRAWIKRSTAARMQFSMLGVVTKLHQKLAYRDNDIASDRGTRLVDLHDHLVDADKQGLSFDEDAWKAWRRQDRIPTNLKAPAHCLFTALDNDSHAEDDNTVDTMTLKPTDEIVDQVYFRVVKPEVDATIARSKFIIADATTVDDDLMARFTDVIKPPTDPVISTELEDLRKQCSKVIGTWRDCMGDYFNKGRKPSDWHEAVRRCRTQFLSILPNGRLHPTIVEWLRPHGRAAATTWEEIRASAFGKYEHAAGNGSTVFYIAGDELGKLKAAQSFSQTRVLGIGFYKGMQPSRKALTRAITEGGGYGSDDEEDLALSEAYFDGLDDVEVMAPAARRMFAAATTPSRGQKRKLELSPVRHETMPQTPAKPLGSPDFAYDLFGTRRNSSIVDSVTIYEGGGTVKAENV